MKENKTYLFKSERLGFRNWCAADMDKMAEINADEKVMEFFPGVVTNEQTVSFIERMQNQYEEKGFCYFAVDKLEGEIFIGFIGLSEQTYKAAFTPYIDIGWRITSREWNKGYATEGAKRCLEFAFNDLTIETINAIAPMVNIKSEHIMKKIGMTKRYEFDHPLLAHDKRLKRCVLYEKRR